NFGACTAVFACASAVCWSRYWPTPSAATSATSAVPMMTLRVRVIASSSNGGASILPGVFRFYALFTALLLAFATANLRAHDIPNDVTVQTFVKPEGTRLRLLVRVPLQAMRDMDFPKPRNSPRGDLMDLGRSESTLRDASTLWISDFLDVYENGTHLPKPQVAAVRASLQSDRSFTSYEEALAHVTAPPLPPDTEFVWSQGLLDVLFEYPIQSDRSNFSIQPRLA